jgi:hypothetical protein
MPGLLNSILRAGCLALILILQAICSAAQSRAAYLQAGDACLIKQDPFCAISYYRQALDYGESPSTYFRLAKADKALYNYAESYMWIQKATPLCAGCEEREEIWRMAADLSKRMGNFSAAFAAIDSLKIFYPEKKEELERLRQYYDTALQQSQDSLSLDVILISGDINSAYSDFAPAIVGDSILYYSSLRYQIKDKNNSIATSRIASASINNLPKTTSVLLPETINQPSFNDANASVSPDGKVMVFTRCLYNDEGKLICGLYESTNNNGRWSEGKRLTDVINTTKGTTTQPCITTNKSEGYLLFFSSNRPGGEGGMDIWWTRRGPNSGWEKPVNAGKNINSAADEWSPFYDAVQSSLYFSTERDSGFGGLDLYKCLWSLQQSGPAEHLKKPYNSGYNDLYFSSGYSDPPIRLLVSNRPPAARLNGSSCCYDIFLIRPSTLVADSTLTSTQDSGLLAGRPASLYDNPPTKEAFSALNDIEQINVLNTILPIRLYFDNDQPDPKTMSAKTEKIYDELTLQYLNREADYVQQQRSPEMSTLISAFFNDSVRSNLSRLETFSNLLEAMLQRYSGRVKITITGTASPLAESRYNVILSNRRIVSLENYWKTRLGGRLKEALDKNTLLLEFIPAGEEKSAANVSDDLRDLSKSVYSREAALERRIELTSIDLIP